MTPKATCADTVLIRPFAEADYEAAVDVANRVWPDFPSTVSEWRFRDGNRDPKIKWGRFVAEKDGAIVAIASYGQSLDMYHPNKFHVDVDVLSEFEGQGIGSALYSRLLHELTPHEPILLRSHGREDLTRGVEFLKKRGFVEEMRDWESRLNLKTFDATAFAGAKERVKEQGIVIRSLAELTDDPDRDHKLYEMDWAITIDMPAPDTFTKPTFEQFQKTVLNNPNFYPEAWFVAIDGNDYVGESALWKSQANSDLGVGATGVLRSHRRRGIAMALKMHAIEFAQSVGCPEIKTWNEQNNVGMLSINVALGFVRQPAWIAFAKTIDVP